MLIPDPALLRDICGPDGGGTRLLQMGVIVEDLDEAMAQWIQLGVGPFYVSRRVALDAVTFGADVVSVELSFALAGTGGQQLELICQHSDEASVWKAPGIVERGLHHMAFMVADFDRAMRGFADRGVETIMYLDAGGIRTAYLDVREQIGYLLEIQESHPTLLRTYAEVEEASRAWDGTDPVRLFKW